MAEDCGLPAAFDLNVGSEKVNSVHRTSPRGPLQEKKGYAVIRDILFMTSDKCSQSESVTQIIKYLFNGGNVANGMFRGHNREL